MVRCVRRLYLRILEVRNGVGALERRGRLRNTGIVVQATQGLTNNSQYHAVEIL